LGGLECIRAMSFPHLGSQQVTRQTANRILVLATAAVHCLEDLGGRDDVIHGVVAQELRQVLDGPWPVQAAATTDLGDGTAFAAVPGTPGVGVRQVVLPIAGCQFANAGCGCRCIGGVLVGVLVAVLVGVSVGVLVAVVVGGAGVFVDVLVGVGVNVGSLPAPFSGTVCWPVLIVPQNWLP
jgi:hypothetical protein